MNRRDAGWRALRRVCRPALDGLRTYWGTAALAVALGIIALVGIAIPASLVGPDGVLAPPRLEVLPIAGGDLGLPWVIFIEDPAATQRSALLLFVRMLGVAGLGTLALAAIAMLCVFGSRAAVRAPELRLQRAVGATRRGLALSALAEGIAVTCAVLALGAALAWLAARAAAASWPGHVGLGRVAPYLWVASGIAAVVTLGALLPVMLARKPSTGAGQDARSPLVPAAILLGASLAVLTGSALLARHADRLLQASAARPVDGLLLPVSVSGGLAERAARYETLLEQVRGQAGNESISLHNPGTPIGLGVVGLVTTDCGRCAESGMPVKWRYVTATHHTVSADSFGTLGLHLIAGRTLTADDRWDAPRVVVVSESLARDYFQDGQAVGRRMRVADEGDGWSMVVGVVKDTAPTAFGATLQPRRAVYVSVLQHPPTVTELLVRGNGRGELGAGLDRALHAALPSFASNSGSTTAAALHAAQVAPLRWFARWLAVEGAAMLAIAVIGTFSLMRLRVLSLLPEIGLRRSVGARRRQILGFIGGQAIGAGIGGVMLGIWFGMPMWEAVTSLVPGLPSWDTALLTYTSLLLAMIALAGALGPGWRAARTSPALLLDAPGVLPARPRARRHPSARG